MSSFDRNDELDSLFARADSVVCLKVGCLCAVPHGDPGTEADLRSSLLAAIDNSSGFHAISDDHDKAEQSPHTVRFSLRASRFTSPERAACGIQEERFEISQLRPPILLSASIDPQKQKFSNLTFLDQSGTLPVQCEVSYDGFLYLAADKSFREGSSPWFGPEVREQLSDALEASGKFDAVTIAPSPIRTDFYFVLFEDDRLIGDRPVRKATGTSGGDWWMTVGIPRGAQVDATLLHAIMADFLEETEGAAHLLYAAGALRDYILDANDHIQSYYQDIAKNVSELYSTSMLNLWGRARRSRAIEKELSEVYRTMVGSKNAEIERNDTVQYMRDAVRESSTLRDLEATLCADCIGPAEELPGPFFEALRHAQSVTSLQTTYQNAVLAALLGGIVGAVISPLGELGRFLVERVR